MATSRPKSSPKPSDDGLALTLTLDWPCLRLADASKPSQHVIIDISVSPNAKKTEVVGWHDGALRVRLNAPPVDGAANEALRRWLADETHLQMNRIELLRGATGRRKQLALQCEAKQIVQWLQRLTEAGTLPGK